MPVAFLSFVPSRSVTSRAANSLQDISGVFDVRRRIIQPVFPSVEVRTLELHWPRRDGIEIRSGVGDHKTDRRAGLRVHHNGIAGEYLGASAMTHKDNSPQRRKARRVRQLGDDIVEDVIGTRCGRAGLERSRALRRGAILPIVVPLQVPAGQVVRCRVDLIEKLRCDDNCRFPGDARAFDHLESGSEIVRRVAQSAVNNDERLTRCRGAGLEIDSREQRIGAGAANGLKALNGRANGVDRRRRMPRGLRRDRHAGEDGCRHHGQCNGAQQKPAQPPRLSCHYFSSPRRAMTVAAAGCPGPCDR